MSKKKQLTLDSNTGKLSRLQEKDLPLLSIDGLNDGDPIAPFGTLTSDIIEYCVYDTSDNYLASGELTYPLPNTLDIGAHIRGLGYERGTYKIVYNFLRQIGGSSKFILTKKRDKSIYTGQYMVETNGKIYASYYIEEDIKTRLLDDKGNDIELLVQDDKYWLQEISPTRTEIRLRPNPAIVDTDYYEQFRLLGYTCLSYSDVSGDSHITFSNDGKTATVNSEDLSLQNAMEGGTLKIREAFVIDYEESDQQITRYTPVVDIETLPAIQNLVTNGHFSGGENVAEFIKKSDSTEIVQDFSNPGHSRYTLRSDGSIGGTNHYWIQLKGIPGESYILSCWVHWTDEWTDHKLLFRGSTAPGGTPRTFDDTDRGIYETKEIDGKLWQRLYKNITIPTTSTDGSVVIWLGDTDGNTNYEDGAYRYITDIQVEVGGVSGPPSPFVIKERVEEEDSPTTGLITFIDDNKVEAVFAEEDDGFINLMMAGSDGRGSGKLTIKGVYVTDQTYSQNEELIVIDDIPLKNIDASDILKGEREFRVSPYHGMGDNNYITLQVDNEFDLFTVSPNGTETLLGSGTDWRTSQTFELPNNIGGLRIETRNQGGPAAFIAKIVYNGVEVKTGDGSQNWLGVLKNWQRRALSGEYDIPPRITRTGPWSIQSNSETDSVLGSAWKTLAKAGKGAWGNKVDDDLLDCSWIWSVNTANNQVLSWTWDGGGSITDKIWQWWDPVLHSDAVKPSGWADGFSSFDFGGIEERKTQESIWHSGWLGHHAKWVDGDGEFGGVAMKFIDQNSEFGTPNHIDYEGEHKTANTSVEPTTLSHRWMGISQTLPHSMAAQGIKPGYQITVSWSQKSDTINKGAMVGLHHYRKDNGSTTWGLTDRISGHHPSTVGDDENGIPMLGAGQEEFLRYRPVSKTGEWEQVKWTGIVEENWDVNKATTLYVYGHYGPEGIVWVENVQIQITEVDSRVDASPTTSDFVGEIVQVDGDTVILSNTYQDSAPDGTVFDNESNIQSYSTFTEFFVDYTSSLDESSPVYGSLRGDIESITDNAITLVNTYAELGEQSGHDFENTVGINQGINFDKWFIQYPNDNQNNLSKLLKLGPNDYSLITNFKYDTQEFPEYPHSLVYKLYEPLPETINEKDFTVVVREMIPPVEEKCTLIPFVEEYVGDIVLRTPEFGNVNSPIGPGQTEFKNYSQLVSSDVAIQENIENEILSGSLSADINVDHSLFKNFIHFSSAEQRVRNFKYKLDLIQQYTDRSSSLAGSNSGSIGVPIGKLSVKADPGAGSYLNVSGSENPHPAFTPVSGSLTQIQSWEKKRRDTINNFDKFEKYMFNQSSSFSSQSIGLFHDNAWPKESGAGTYSNPYILYRTSQSAATDWYTEQLLSASAYDKANKNRLQSHLPMFVQDDDENKVFLKFVDMIGHHFDDMWVFIKSMTDVYDKRDKLTEGVAKNLLEPVAKSLGWTVHDGKDLIALPQYMFGMMVSGSEKPQEYSITPDRDISREIWSRIVNNMPYFLKTKGTSRAIKGLISCYGIPSSILRVIEYGGPKLPGQSAEHFLTRKFTKALNFYGSGNNTYVQYNAWSPVISGSAPTNRVPDTIEFRFKAATGSNQVLVRRDTDWAIRLKENDSVDNRGHVSFMLSGSDGYKEVSSSNLPVYDNEFWSVMLTRTLWDGSFVASDAVNQNVAYKLHTKKYDAGRSKIIYESSETLYITGSSQPSYNLAYSGSNKSVTLGGPEQNTYFGESFSGSMMEYRNWTTALNTTSFDNHVAAPIAFDGNTPSASYIDLVTRYSFDDDKDLSVTANRWFQDASADTSFTASATPYNYTSGMGDHFSPVVDETKMKVPNLGPSGRSSRKVRIEADTLIDKVGSPVLKFGESITIPAYDNAPIDSNKLGIFFSPSAAIDEDIILSMPNLDFDQYIGDPRDQYKEQYSGLVEARNLYWQKYSGPNNFWDYLRLIKYYDSSLYEQVKDLVPARANATVGILIEPTVLERDKIIVGKKPTFEPQHHITRIDVTNEYSESAEYQAYEDNMNWSNPFGINKESMTTGSYMSSSAQYETLEVNLTYTDPFRVNYYTQLSGSEPRGFISASAERITGWGTDTLPINISDPNQLNNRKQTTGSSMEVSATFSSYNAPTDTLSANAAGTGSFVIKHILERPAIYNVGDLDTSGWYGADYYNSTIQLGSVKSIFEEVVMPRYERNVISQFNDEIEYYYSSSLSASLHKPYSSSFVRSDLDNRWDESIGTDRLFYLGCVQTDASTVSDTGGNYADNTPAIDVVMVSPTKLTTTDKTTTKMDVKNK
jgi:hypothetical protein